MKKDIIEIRKNGELLADGNTVFGKAISFDTPSDNLRFVEIIERGAVTEETLRKSDVYARFNHSDDYILARCRHMDKNASLKLELREDGLYYSFELPMTSKGKEVQEHIRRGELDGSSFCFVVGEDELEVRADGTRVRHVKKIDYLVDVAPVYLPAYNSTSVGLRSGEDIEDVERRFAELEQRNNVEDEPVTEETEQTTEEGDNNDTTDNDTTPSDVDDNVNNDDNEERTEEVENDTNDDSLDNNNDDNDDNGNQDDNNEEITDTTEEVEDNNDNKEQKNNCTIMKKEKRFSLISAINDVVANRTPSKETEAVCRAGREQFAESGMTYNGQITLPVNTEERGIINVATEGEDTVDVICTQIMKPLQAKLVFNEVGAKFMSGLRSNITVPVMGKASCTWEAENDDAADANIQFTSVQLSPKRLTTSCMISRTFLQQASEDAENYIIEEIINAIKEKLEETILSNAAATTKSPGGIKYDRVATSIANFSDLTLFEAELDAANVDGERKYIVSNRAKAALRNMTKGSSLALVWENNEVDGTKAVSTSNMGAGKDILYGQWDNLIIGQWGGIDLTIDPLTAAKKNAIVVTVNALFDAQIARPEAFAYGTIGE